MWDSRPRLSVERKLDWLSPATRADPITKGPSLPVLCIPDHMPEDYLED